MTTGNLYPDSLFLLEFLVEKVHIYPRALPPYLLKDKGEIIISLTFFQNEPLDICKEDFDPINGCPDCDGRPRNGKSCLFALDTRTAKSAMKIFDINIIAYKLADENDLVDRYRIGDSTISIAKEFSIVVQKSWEEGTTNPLTQTHISSTLLKNNIADKCCCIGDLNMFVRISCFGKTIVTQIQMNKDASAVFFKDKDGKSLYKFAKKAREKCKDNNDICVSPPCNTCSPDCSGFNPSCIPKYRQIPSCSTANTCAPQRFCISTQPTGEQLCWMTKGSRMCLVPLLACLGNEKDEDKNNKREKKNLAEKNGMRKKKKRNIISLKK